MADPEAINLMLVDDEKSVVEALKRNLQRAYPAWNIDVYDSPEEALRQLRHINYNVIVSDYKMAPINGVEFLSDSKVYQRDAKRIILSGQSDAAAVVAAVNESEIYRYVMKPVSAEELANTVAQALDYQRIERENDRLASKLRRLQNNIKECKTSLEGLAGQHPEIQRILDSLEID